jgi:hypothetical protein
MAWRLEHDVEIGRIEAKSCRWQTVSHKIHPQQLSKIRKR